MNWKVKLGWFWIAFALWFFILVVLMHGCTPLKKAEAAQSCQYEIIHMTHVNLSTGEAALNELARQGWRVLDVDWFKSGDKMQGFYTLEKCS